MASRARVLYIEDDLLYGRLVQRVLQQSGYDVLLAPDGEEGLALAQETRPNLILMDLNLPQIDGRVLTTRLRGQTLFKDTPIVALTAMTGSEQRRLALAAGCTGFMTKPINVDKFPQQINAYLKGQQQELAWIEKGRHLEQLNQNLVASLEEKIRLLEETNAHMAELTRLKGNFLQMASLQMEEPILTTVAEIERFKSGLAQLDAAQPAVETVALLIQRMEHGMDRLKQVVAEMMQTAQVVSGLMHLRFMPVDMERLVAEVVERYQQMCQERVLHIYRDDLSDLPLVNGDYAQLRTAVDNLISNAIKYTPDGGHIYIHGEVTPTEICLAIRDTGIGVPAAEQESIFELFHSAQPVDYHSTSKYAFKGSGLGLGLPVVKGIVEAHDGRIWVESDSDEENPLPGSTFTICLPRADVEKASPVPTTGLLS